MKSYETRKEEAKQLIEKSNKKGLELYIELYLKGVSLRIIEDLTKYPKSKLHSYLTKYDLKREDEYNTQKKEKNIKKTLELLKYGYSERKIAKQLNISEKTVKSYIRLAKNRKNKQTSISQFY